MKIRSATAADESVVADLWQACGLTAPHNDALRDFRFALGKPGSDILVAEENGIAGSVMVGHDGHRGWLYYVAVSPSHRKQGLGRALVKAAEDWLAARGVPKAQLMIRENNSDVAAFYKQLGYELMPRINMQKWLKP